MSLTNPDHLLLASLEKDLPDPPAPWLHSHEYIRLPTGRVYLREGSRWILIENPGETVLQRFKKLSQSFPTGAPSPVTAPSPKPSPVVCISGLDSQMEETSRAAEALLRELSSSLERDPSTSLRPLDTGQWCLSELSRSCRDFLWKLQIVAAKRREAQRTTTGLAPLGTANGG
jgi:hypothetical protein